MTIDMNPDVTSTIQANTAGGVGGSSPSSRTIGATEGGTTQPRTFLGGFREGNIPVTRIGLL